MSEDRHQIRPYPIRMPEEVRAYLEVKAKEKGRSLHAEIIRRLEGSIKEDHAKAQDVDPSHELASIATSLKKISNYIATNQELQDVIKNHHQQPSINRQFEEQLKAMHEKAKNRTQETKLHEPGASYEPRRGNE